MDFELPNSKCVSTAPASCVTSAQRVNEIASSSNDEEHDGDAYLEDALADVLDKAMVEVSKEYDLESD